MGVGVETSAQLDGFRHNGKMPTFGECPTWWMSATLDDARLATVDHPKPAEGWPSEKLSDIEQSTARPHELVTAAKRLSPVSLGLDATTKSGYAKLLAKLVADRHRVLLEKTSSSGTLTLVIVNRVSRAREVYQALTVGKNPLYDPAKVALIHSRFRPADSERHTKLLFSGVDRIVIATQAIEAGVDVSARLLVTELAPWSSLVQRMGRCNRRADIPDAEVLWVDIQPKDEKDDLLLPYTGQSLPKRGKPLSKLPTPAPLHCVILKFRKNPSSAQSSATVILWTCSTPRRTFAVKTLMFPDTSAMATTVMCSFSGATLRATHRRHATTNLRNALNFAGSPSVTP